MPGAKNRACSSAGSKRSRATRTPEPAGAPGVSTTGATTCNPSVPLRSPVSDPALAELLRCGVRAATNGNLRINVDGLPPGRYLVRLYVRSLDGSTNRWFGSQLEGRENGVFDPGKAGQWQRMRIGRVTVSDGSLQIDLSHARRLLVSGLEIWAG